jgi:hypothetical protein
MGKIQEEILEAFYEELGKAEAVDDEMVKRLRQLLSSEKKVKADEVAAILSGSRESVPQ